MFVHSCRDLMSRNLWKISLNIISGVEMNYILEWECECVLKSEESGNVFYIRNVIVSERIKNKWMDI